METKVWVIYNTYQPYWSLFPVTNYYGDMQCNNVSLYDNPRFFKSKQEAMEILSKDSEFGYNYLRGYKIKQLIIKDV